MQGQKEGFERSGTVPGSVATQAGGAAAAVRGEGGKRSGRSYRAEFAVWARRYFDAPSYDEKRRLWLFPTRMGFRDLLASTGTDVPLETLAKWERTHKAFGREMAHGEQRVRDWYVQLAVNDKLNATFTRFYLTVAHGMNEKDELSGTDRTLDVSIRVIGGENGGEGDAPCA